MKKEKNKPERMGVIYYWKQADGVYAMQIVHNTCYSEMDSAVSEKAVKMVAAKLGYEAVQDNG